MRLSKEEFTARQVAAKITGNLEGSEAVFLVAMKTKGNPNNHWRFSATIDYAIEWGNGRIDLFFKEDEMIGGKHLKGNNCELHNGVYEVTSVLKGKEDTIVSIKLVNSA